MTIVTTIVTTTVTTIVATTVITITTVTGVLELNYDYDHGSYVNHSKF